MNNVLTIAGFEFVRFFKWKQELISIALLAVIALISLVWIYFDSKEYDVDPHRIAWQSDMPLPELDLANHEFIAVDATEAIDVDSEEWSLVVRASDYAFEVTTEELLPWQTHLLARLQEQWQLQQLQQLTLPENEKRFLELPKVDWIETKTNSEAETDDIDNDNSLVFLYLLLAVGVGALTSFGYLFSSITKEKQQRVTEQLLVLVQPGEWIDGKVLGITLHSIKAAITMVVYFIFIFQGIFWFLAGEFIALDVSAAILLAIPFLVLGLLIINAIIAAFAATIDDPNHSSKTYIMFLPYLPLGWAFFLMERMESGLAYWSSFIPFTSFAVMPMRIIEGNVAWWEVAISFVLLLALLWGARRVALGIFKSGIRRYGQEPSIKDMLRSIAGS